MLTAFQDVILIIVYGSRFSAGNDGTELVVASRKAQDAQRPDRLAV